MKRMVLLLTTVTLATAMVLTSAVLSIAQEEPPTDTAPFEDTTDNPSFDDTGDEPPTDTAPFEDTTDNPSFGDDSGQEEAPLCTPEWLQEWHPDFASGWWWFWWYQWCWTSKDGWYRSYDGWDWGPPIW